MAASATLSPRVTVLAPALGAAATILGISRFGYGVMLPSMRLDLGWTLTQAGLLDTANALGYVIGAAVSGRLLQRFAPASVLRVCAGAVTLSLIGCALVEAYPVLLAMRAIAGLGASILFVVGGLLATRLGSASGRPGLVLGVYYAGVGPGILVTSLLLPTLLTVAHRWPGGWLILALLCTFCAIVAGTAAGRVPEHSPASVASSRRRRDLGWVLAAFVLFGIGYVPFTTFAVEYWKQESTAALTVTGLWALLALMATASGWVWTRLQRRAPIALIVLLAVVMIAVGLPLLSTALPALTISAALFGLSFLAVSAAVTGIIRENTPAPRWPTTIAAFTTAFGAGQVAGPLLTGVLADAVGLRGGLGLAAALLGVAMVCAAVHAERTAHEPHAHSRTG
jgi:predicted MFS family arabinose efflux permease